MMATTMTTIPAFTRLQESDHEAVLFCQDRATGLKGFIALHNTTLGPGLGGCRMMAYPNEEAALQDVLNLSRAMTYKNALAGLDYGGGKSLIWLESPQQKTPALVQAFAHRIHLLAGSYYTATDIGSTSEDMRLMREVTPYVSALDPNDGGLGDSSTLTGFGVYQGIKAAVKHQRGTDSLEGLTLAIQGTGKVACHLMSYLVKENCRILASDTNPAATAYAKAQFPDIELVAPETLFTLPVDVLSPNAIGGTITQQVAETTTATIIAGGANNPLAAPQLADTLQARGILFAPDFAINSGGVILLSTELAKGTVDEARVQTARIYNTALKVFQYAETHGLNPLVAAEQLALHRIATSQAAPVSTTIN